MREIHSTDKIMYLWNVAYIIYFISKPLFLAGTINMYAIGENTSWFLEIIIRVLKKIMHGYIVQKICITFKDCIDTNSLA